MSASEYLRKRLKKEQNVKLELHLPERLFSLMQEAKKIARDLGMVKGDSDEEFIRFSIENTMRDVVFYAERVCEQR